MKIAEISIKRPSIIIVLFITLLLGGIFSYKNLSYELIPKFEVNVITVATVYPGASPSEIENTVTKKIEDAVASLENVKKVEAMSFESLSTVMIYLNADANVDLSLNDAQRKINAILKDLPKDVDPPSLQKYSLSDLPILTLSVTSNLSEKELYDLLDKKIQPIFSRVTGVAKVQLIGGEEREIQVLLDPKKIEAYGLSVPMIQQVVLGSNLDFPTGSVKSSDKQTLIRLAGKYKNVEEMRNLVIASQKGIDIRLSDVADIQDGIKEIDKIARLNQESTILMQVIKQSDANAVTVSELTHNAIQEVEKNYSDTNLKIKVANDSSEFTLEAANAVMFDLFLAIVLVAFVMLFFLHSLRNALIVMVAIPLSLVATFIGIYLLGYSLNLLSLLALSLVVGILVDDAIVVIENIHRHMEMGKNKVRASYDGAKEIGFTVTAITLVIIVVFLPIAMSSGLVPNIIKQFCVTVIIATMFSLLVSFTIVPWLFSRFGKIEVINPSTLFGRILHGFERGLNSFTHTISDLLVWALNSTKNTIVVLIIVGISFFTAVALIPMGYIGAEFFPKTDKGEFLVQLELEKDASLQQTNKITQKAEEFLRTKPEIVDMITTVGQSSEGYGGAQATKYKSEIQVILTDKKLRKENSFVYAAKLKNELAPIMVGAKVKTVPIGLLGAEEAPLALTVTGANLDDAMDFAIQAKEILDKIPGTMETKLTTETGSPEINVQVNRDKMAALGLDMYTVGMTMQTAFNGNTDGKFRAGEYEYDINIRFQEYSRSTIDNVKDISFKNNVGQDIKLDQFADIKYSSGPSVLERRDKSPSVTIKSQTIGRAPGAIADEWLPQFDQLKIKPGVKYLWTGTMEDQEEGFGTLGIALLAAITLVYLVMVALYDSFTKPFIVIFSVPLSFIGALLALAIANITLNIFTILGIIMLIGLVCKNAILLVDFANHRVSAGDNVHDALIAANHARLRPILMTTIAMVIGMVPIALADGAGAEMNNGLAVVIIGGLLSSLLLTLVIVPIIYSIFDKIGSRMSKKEDIDYEQLMTADYKYNEDFVDEFASTTHNDDESKS